MQVRKNQLISAMNEQLQSELLILKNRNTNIKFVGKTNQWREKNILRKYNL